MGGTRRPRQRGGADLYRDAADPLRHGGRDALPGLAREHADAQGGAAGRDRLGRAVPCLRRLKPHDRQHRSRRCRLHLLVRGLPVVDLAQRRPIGRTGLSVTVLGFGGNVLGNLYAPLDEEAALDAVVAAYETGVRYFDTAPLYGHGLSEHRIGHVLRRYPRDGFALSTKVGRLLKPHGRVPPPRLPPSQGGIFAGELPFQPLFDFTHDGVLRSVEDSLQRDRKSTRLNSS